MERYDHLVIGGGRMLQSLPRQVGVNPNLTITMLAERCAEWVLAE